MSTNPKTCNICDDRHITKHATDWCSECEQAFCNECKEYHAFSRLSKTHITIPISDFLSLEPSFTNFTSICAEHGEIYQIFCQTHETLLCHNCLAEHDGCKGIVPLTEMIKNVKSSTNFQETQNGLTDIYENITRIQDELKLSLEAIKDEEKIIMSDIGTMWKKIDEHLDKLENDLRKDLSKEATESRAAIEVLVQKLDDRKSEIAKHLQQMKNLETYASDFQTYISLREKSVAVNSTETLMQSVAEDGNLEIDTLSLNFDEKINAIVSNIQVFGGSDHHIHIVDISRSILKVHKSIPTENSCFGIAYSDGSLFCCIYKEGIQKISLENYNVSTMVKFDLSFGYIAVLNNNLYYTDRNTNTVTCCNTEGELLWTFTDATYFTGPCGLSIDNKRFVYVVSSEMNRVIVLSPDEENKRVLVTDSEGLKSPYALQFDKLRNRLLVANNNSTVFLFDVLV
ncbi:Hypothetical predicted protein [Mytilus galloprovincialis]|uniref:B box-type domain-containing protein n=1 Tax=Mytilus galloprovincialis TaxID=29158 RepID=A0A8B6CXG4_MYTGA|nr:Hypothetical predicted protein [Mytilus galloprovincialis]